MQRQKLTVGTTTQIQDILQWQQGYNIVPQQQQQTQEVEGEGNEGDGIVTLTREFLLQAKNAPDGLPVDIGICLYVS